MLLECSHGTWYNGYYVLGKCLENNIMQGVAYWCAQLEIISVLNRKVFWVFNGKLMVCIW